jgi:hypothetical protein
MEGVKTWLSSQVAALFDTRKQTLIPREERDSVPAMTTFRSSLSMYFCI